MVNLLCLSHRHFYVKFVSPSQLNGTWPLIPQHIYVSPVHWHCPEHHPSGNVMMKRPSILFCSQDIPFFSEENLSELVSANDNINGIHTQPSSYLDTDSETESEYGSNDEDSSNLNNLVNIQNNRRQMSNYSNEQNTEELISLFKKTTIKTF